MQPRQPIERVAPGVVRLHVKVVPGSSRTCLAGLRGTRLRIKVAAPPEGGKANKTLIRFLADVFRIQVSAIRVVRGSSAQEKTLELDDISIEDVRHQLAGILRD